MKFLICVCLIFLVLPINSFGRRKKNVNYVYKKYEKFDFNNLNIDANGGAPGDLSINPRNYRKHKNKLPSKLNFNKEMSRAIDGIR